jgi:PPOX class probable F420-dependent enzyme
MWDVSTPFGARVERRLNEELIIWLVTQGADGTPQPSPVWFLREGNALLIYSRASTPKMRNIARAPKVALHFNSDGTGGDIIVFHGTAEALADPPALTSIPAYTEKYRQGIASIGMSEAHFATAYAAAIRVTIEAVRGH